MKTQKLYDIAGVYRYIVVVGICRGIKPINITGTYRTYKL